MPVLYYRFVVTYICRSPHYMCCSGKLVRIPMRIQLCRFNEPYLNVCLIHSWHSGSPARIIRRSQPCRFGVTNLCTSPHHSCCSVAPARYSKALRGIAFAFTVHRHKSTAGVPLRSAGTNTKACRVLNRRSTAGLLLWSGGTHPVLKRRSLSLLIAPERLIVY